IYHDGTAHAPINPLVPNSGSTSTGRALSACWLHRHQHGQTDRARYGDQQSARHRGGMDQGKNALRWPRLSCCSFSANALHLQLHALAYNLGNFMRTLAMPQTAEPWSLTSLREKLIKIGAEVVRHGRYVVFQM